MEKTMEAVCLAEKHEDAGGRVQCTQARQQDCSSGKNKAKSDAEGMGDHAIHMYRSYKELGPAPRCGWLKDKHSRMTKQRVGMGNCILGLGVDVGTNTWHESHIF